MTEQWRFDMGNSTPNANLKPGIYRERFSYENNFTQVKNSWLRDPNLSMKAKGLLVYFMTHEIGYTITLGQIEREMSDGKSAIRAAIDELVEVGYLVTQRTVKENGWNAGLAYILSEPAKTPMSENPTLENPTLENRTAYREQNLIREENLKENIHPHFEQFWNVFPRKAGKQDAIKAFDKAVTNFGFDVVLAGAIRFAHDPNLPSKEFIPYPATWLNRGSWDDEPLPERTKTLDEVRSDEVEISRQKLARDRELTQQLIAEQPKTGTPPPECKHGNIIIKCRKCLLGID
jgi:predicted DNA-binding transcriptional regulator